MKTSKKLLVVVLALVMILACAAPAFADPVTYPASYTQDPIADSPTVSGTFTVYLTVESYIYDDYGAQTYFSRQHLPVSMGATGVERVYTVSDVLYAASSQYTDLIFTNGSGVPITGSSDYVYGIKDTNAGNRVFAPLVYLNPSHRPYNAYYAYGYGPQRLNDRNGWMFRINEKFVILDEVDYPAGRTLANDGPQGAAINQAYVQPNDYIWFHFCNSNEGADSTNWSTIKDISYNSSTKKLTFGIYVSNSYYQNSNDHWIISDYEPMESSYVTVLVDGVSKNVSTNSSGMATISNLNLSAGTHTIYLPLSYCTYYYEYNDSDIQYYLPYTTGVTIVFTTN